MSALLYDGAMLRSAWVLLFALAFVLPGCVGIQSPRVEVVGIRLDQVSQGGGRVLFDLRVINPNDEELPIPQINYRVDIVGAELFEHTARPNAAVPRLGEVTLTLVSAVRGVSLRGQAVSVDGEVVFAPQGELRRLVYENYVPLPEAPFSLQATLNQ